MTTSNKNEVADVIIFGGGVAGSAFALDLTSRGVRVLVLHRDDKRHGIETISPAACSLLGRIIHGHGSEFSLVAAWWGSEKVSTQSHAGARAICRQSLAALLRTEAAKGAKFLPVKTVASISRTQTKWQTVYIDSLGCHRTAEADFICDATGRRSVVGRHLGAIRQSTDKLCCVTTETVQSGQAGTWTEAASNGWWNLCSNGQTATLSFYSTPNVIRDASKNFIEFLAQTKEMAQLVTASEASKKSIHFCNSSLLQPAAGPHWISIGDATMSLQPLASAGVTRALRDANRAAPMLFGDISQYNEMCRAEFKEYQKELLHQYSLETRWPGSNFWSDFQHEAETSNSL